MKTLQFILCALLIAALAFPCAAQTGVQQEPVKCRCGAWQKIDILKNGLPLGTVRCKDAPPLFPALTTDAIKVVPLYLCAPASCLPSYRYRIDAGPILPLPLSFTLPPLAAGAHTVRVYAYCLKQICDSCAFRIDVKPGQQQCACGGVWSNQLITWGGAAAPVKIPFECNKEQNVVNGPAVGISFTVSATYTCNPTPPCAATYKWSLNGNPRGPAPATFSAVAPGIYKIALIAWCDRTKCDSCWVLVKVPMVK